MQQRSRALKRVLSVSSRCPEGLASAQVVPRREALRFAVLASAALALTGCGAAWTGAWGGTADLGPVNAHALTLTLADKDSTVTLADVSGESKTLSVCFRKVVDRKITLVVDTGRPDCSTGADARRLRLEGWVGAGVIHGDLFRGQQRVGFFRAFRAPAPDSPGGSRPTPDGPTASPRSPSPHSASNSTR